MKRGGRKKGKAWEQITLGTGCCEEDTGGSIAATELSLRARNNHGNVSLVARTGGKPRGRRNIGETCTRAAKSGRAHLISALSQKSGEGGPGVSRNQEGTKMLVRETIRACTMCGLRKNKSGKGKRHLGV